MASRQERAALEGTPCRVAARYGCSVTGCTAGKAILEQGSDLGRGVFQMDAEVAGVRMVRHQVYQRVLLEALSVVAEQGLWRGRWTGVLFCFVWLATLGAPVVAPRYRCGYFPTRS